MSAESERYADPTARAAIGRAMRETQNNQHFTISGRLSGYNELNAGHWTKRNGLKKRDMKRVEWEIARRWIKPVDGRAVIKIVCYEPNKKRDPSNVRAGAEKIVLDALQNKHIIRNDNWRWLEDYPTLVDYDKQNPRVEVTIEEMRGCLN